MTSKKKNQKNDNRHSPSIKEIKIYGMSSMDEHSSQKKSEKCDSPKFFRTQSFGILSPKSQIKFFGNVKNKHFDFGDRSATASDSDERINSRSVSSSKNSVRTLTQVQEILDESCEYDVGELRGLERLKRLRSRFRKTSFSVETNFNSNRSNARYVFKMKYFLAKCEERYVLVLSRLRSKWYSVLLTK